MCILAVAILAIFAYAFYKEGQSLGCASGFGVLTRVCDNANSPIIKRIKNIESAAFELETMVFWRRSFIFAAVMAACAAFVYATVPSRAHAFVMTAILFVAILYFSHNFYNYHLYRHISNALRKLGANIKDQT